MAMEGRASVNSGRVSLFTAITMARAQTAFPQTLFSSFFSRLFPDLCILTPHPPLFFFPFNRRECRTKWAGLKAFFSDVDTNHF